MIGRAQRRTFARIMLALMVFAQASFAYAGCLGSRVASPASIEQEDCALATLLCRAHCQAQDQTVDPVQIAIPDAGECPSPVEIDVTLIVPPVPAPDWSWRLPPAATPPPFIRFARLLN